MSRAMGAEGAAQSINLLGILAIPMVEPVIGRVLLFLFGVVNDHSADLAWFFGMGAGGESGGPGNIAMAGGIEGIAALGEDPARAVE